HHPHTGQDNPVAVHCDPRCSAVVSAAHPGGDHKPDHTLCLRHGESVAMAGKGAARNGGRRIITATLDTAVRLPLFAAVYCLQGLALDCMNRHQGMSNTNTLAPFTRWNLSSTSARLACSKGMASTSDSRGISAASCSNSITSLRATLATLWMVFS